MVIHRPDPRHGGGRRARALLDLLAQHLAVPPNSLRLSYLHLGRNWTKGDVLLVEAGKQRVVTKDISRAPQWFRVLWARRSLRREYAVYQAGRALPGLPHALGWIDSDAYMMEYVAGTALSDLRPGEVQQSVFDSIEATLAGLHKAGLAHGDLHRENILLTADGRVYLLDFGYGIVMGHHPGPMKRYLFPRYVALDRHRLLRMKRAYFPNSVGEEQLGRYEQWLLPYRVGKALRSWLRRGRSHREQARPE